MVKPAFELEDEILDAAGLDFPAVTKRVFKVPDNLKYDSPEYDDWATERMYDILTEDRSNDKQQRIVKTSDVFMRRVDENGDSNGPWLYAYSYKNTSTNNKYPAVGGPLDGKGICRNTEGYIGYNCADNFGRSKKKNHPTMIMIHESLIHTPLKGLDT